MCLMNKFLFCVIFNKSDMYARGIMMLHSFIFYVKLFFFNFMYLEVLFFTVGYFFFVDVLLILIK